MSDVMDGNGTNQLLGKLLERTDSLISDVRDIKLELGSNASSIRNELAQVAIRTEARLAALELRNAEAKGGTKMMMMFGGAAATVGGIVASIIDKVWPT
jgi:hypothetical protein